MYGERTRIVNGTTPWQPLYGLPICEADRICARSDVLDVQALHHRFDFSQISTLASFTMFRVRVRQSIVIHHTAECLRKRKQVALYRATEKLKTLSF